MVGGHAENYNNNNNNNNNTKKKKAQNRWSRPKRKYKNKQRDINLKIRKRYRQAGLPASFSGAGALRGALATKSLDVRRALLGEQSYTLHRPVVRRFPRRKVIVSGPFDQFQCDLVDCSSYKQQNEGTRFLLCTIDVFSRFAWVRTLKTKTGKEVTRAFVTVLDEAGRAPLYVQCDKGREFRSSAFEGECHRRGIKVFSTENDDIKACIVERFQQTLQSMIHRYFTATRGRRFLEVLPLLVKTYNRTVHRSIGMAPADVRPDNYEVVWQRLYLQGDKKKSKGKNKTSAGRRPPSLSVDDHVRMSGARRQFAKGYLAGWSREIYRVSAVLQTNPVTYRVSDGAGDMIKGSFYERELQMVEPPEVYDVERILDSRTRGGKREFLVKWLGYPSSFNSWETRILDVPPARPPS